MAEREPRGVTEERISATKLPSAQQQQLREMLQLDLTRALINWVKANPPEVDLTKVEVIVPAGKEMAQLEVASECGTCATCICCPTAAGSLDTAGGVTLKKTTIRLG